MDERLGGKTACRLILTLRRGRALPGDVSGGDGGNEQSSATRAPAVSQ